MSEQKTYREGDIVTPATRHDMPLYIIYNIRYLENGDVHMADFFCLNGPTVYKDINGLTLNAFNIVS